MLALGVEAAGVREQYKDQAQRSHDTTNGRIETHVEQSQAGRPEYRAERLKELDVPLQTWLFAFCA